MNDRIESLYSEIADALHENINSGFDTAWINVEMQKDVGLLGVYFKTPDAQCFTIRPSVSLFKLFNALWHEFIAAGQPAWSTATFTIHSDGKFNLDFGYDNVSDGRTTSLDRVKAWMKKHLGDVQVKELA